jgi:rod shape-determining protein MreC
VTINLGSKDGMKNNMAVMTVDGLLGRINHVTDFNSTVQLLTELDETSNTTKGIAATVKGKENESFGIIESFDVQQQKLSMTKIQQTDKVEVGDTIITSGLGQIFPKGIEIGTVVSKEVDKFGLTYKALVEP